MKPWKLVFMIIQKAHKCSIRTGLTNYPYFWSNFVQCIMKMLCVTGTTQLVRAVHDSHPSVCVWLQKDGRSLRDEHLLHKRNTGNMVSVGGTAVCQVSYALFGQICGSLTVRAGWFSLLRAGSWLMCHEGNFPQLCPIQKTLNHLCQSQPPSLPSALLSLPSRRPEPACWQA